MSSRSTVDGWSTVTSRGRDALDPRLYDCSRPPWDDERTRNRQRIGDRADLREVRELSRSSDVRGAGDNRSLEDGAAAAIPGLTGPILRPGVSFDDSRFHRRVSFAPASVSR